MAKLLIVEDEPMLRQLCQEEFEFLGYEVFQASNGGDGLAAAQRLLPDVILMDVDFGGSKPNGLEATEILKRQEATKSIPVIVMTGRVMPSEREKAFAAGCDELVEKGHHFDDLIKAVELQLSLKRQ